MIQHQSSTPTLPARVMVLGASGFIGQYLIRHLSELGMQAVPLASREIDLGQPESVAKLREVVRAEDSVVFASALTPDRGRDRRAMLKNLAMGDHVSQFLENNPCSHLIYISSDAVYRDGEHPIREISCCQPSSLYGFSHLVREEMLREVTKRAGTPLVVLRPCAIYGAADTHNSYGPNRFRRMALEQRKITLFGQGEEKRDHIYIADVVRLIGLCLLHKSTGTLNLATGQSVSFMEVAQKVAALTEGQVEIEGLPRSSPITHLHFDVTATLKAFPEFNFTSLDEGLTAMVEKASMANG